MIKVKQIIKSINLPEKRITVLFLKRAWFVRPDKQIKHTHDRLRGMPSSFYVNNGRASVCITPNKSGALKSIPFFFNLKMLS